MGKAIVSRFTAHNLKKSGSLKELNLNKILNAVCLGSKSPISNPRFYISVKLKNG